MVAALTGCTLIAATHIVAITATGHLAIFNAMKCEGEVCFTVDLMDVLIACDSANDIDSPHFNVLAFLALKALWLLCHVELTAPPHPGRPPNPFASIAFAR